VLRELANQLYRSSRDMESGIDPAIGDSEVAGVVMSKAIARLRAVSRGMSTGFVGKRVQIINRRHVTVGKNVSISHSAMIDGLSRTGVIIGDNVTIDSYAQIKGSGVIRNLGEGVYIGDRTAIGMFNVIWGQGGVRIGSDCLFGPHVQIYSENHIFASPHTPIRDQGELRDPTFIGDDVWIGAGATILAGCLVGDRAVVAAGSVVTKSVAAGSIVAGVPAKRIGTR
jgi:acetyltransferase-like isoleucine patch superfamily enzyme